MTALSCVMVAMVCLSGCGEARRASRLPIPESASLEPAIVSAGPSTVRITGSACGLATAGSGAVVGDHLVLTAAHVVAGATESQVVDAAGSHPAVPVIVDPLSDMAVLYVDGLGDAPLLINDDPARRGTIGVVLGYPRSGGLDVSPAVVLDAYRAEGHDIYGQQSVVRRVLEMQALIVAGYSGGPLVDSAGMLIGMVFGQSEDEPDIGYALTAAAIREVVDEAFGLTNGVPDRVSTGECLPSVNNDS